MGKRTTFGVLLLNAVIVFLSLGFRHQTLVHLTEITQGYSSSLPYLIMNLELLFFTLFFLLHTVKISRLLTGLLL